MDAKPINNNPNDKSLGFSTISIIANIINTDDKIGIACKKIFRDL